VSMSPVVRHDVETCAGGGRAASGAAGWLGLAAAPTFAIMALWTGLFSGKPDMLCMAMQGSSPMSGMTLMYLLMSAFHAAPWLKLISSQRNGARQWNSAHWYRSKCVTGPRRLNHRHLDSFADAGADRSGSQCLLQVHMTRFHTDPTLNELLDDPVTKAIMKADRVDPQKLEATLRSLAREIAGGSPRIGKTKCQYRTALFGWIVLSRNWRLRIRSL
jgi:hypothetical protein